MRSVNMTAMQANSPVPASVALVHSTARGQHSWMCLCALSIVYTSPCHYCPWALLRRCLRLGDVIWYEREDIMGSLCSIHHCFLRMKPIKH